MECLRPCSDCQTKSVFWHILIISRLIKENLDSFTFGGGLKRSFSRMSKDGSQSGRSGCSNRIEVLQRDTQRQRHIQSDGVHQSGWAESMLGAVKSRFRTPPSLSLSGATEEFCTPTWQCDCLKGRDDKISISLAYALESHYTSIHSYWHLWQTMQLSWQCRDTQILCDHMQITVQNVRLKHLIWETNLFACSLNKTLVLMTCCVLVTNSNI